ncbi:MAG: hypothetical protein ACLQQ4_00275 [Bacteroidia bacterium]
MKKIKLLNVIIAIGIATALFSCKGDTGPQGPAGSSGSVNVTVTAFTVPQSGWVPNATYPWEIDYSLSTAGITINVSGSVECFYSPDSANFTQLPWITDGTAPYYEQSWEYNVDGNISFRWYNVTSNTTPPTPLGNSYFKVVSIPPAVIKQHPNTNWNNWNEVKAVIEEQKAENHN